MMRPVAKTGRLNSGQLVLIRPSAGSEPLDVMPKHGLRSLFKILKNCERSLDFDEIDAERRDQVRPLPTQPAPA